MLPGLLLLATLSVGQTEPTPTTASSAPVETNGSPVANGDCGADGAPGCFFHRLGKAYYDEFFPTDAKNGD
jgi:hypothetical protein